MTTTIRYVHTNIVAKDWRTLADFYCRVFACEPVLPERNLQGEWLARLTGIEGATIQGIHLRLPGFGDAGPTLEVFSYQPALRGEGAPALQRPGLAHLAFHVADVADSLQQVLAHGGAVIGELVRQDYGDLGILTVVYTRDPEGNIVELQNWQQEN